MTTTVSDIEDKLKQLKLEGNKYFKQKKYQTAIKYYTEAVDHKIYDAHISEIKPLIKLRQSLLLNRAKSHFKLKHLKEALIDTSNCIHENNGTKLAYKAHYTRAEIYQSLGDFKNAIRHCDQILKENNPSLNMSELQTRTKELKRRIREESMVKSTAKSKKHGSYRSNNILNAMTMSIGEQRERVQRLQHSNNKTNNNNHNTNNCSNKSDVALIISSQWWRKWNSIDSNMKLTEIDMKILIVDNSNLINFNNEKKEEAEDKKEEEKEEKKEELIEISSIYLDHNLRCGLLPGKDSDYIILNFLAYQDMIQMGYKIQPPIWVKKCDRYNLENNKMEKHFELYKTKFKILYSNNTFVYLLCSINETIRKIITEIARYFVIQSSSIRLRYNNIAGEILDRSHTLGQHGIISKILYVEIRLPNGCWPTNNNIINNNNNNDKHICSACQRIISHYVLCNKCIALELEKVTKYCNTKHMRSHMDYHKLEHKMHFSRIRRYGICGLENLGNTCYMNSSLQCLSFISELRSYLICNDYYVDINKENPLGYKGELAKVFASFLKKMWFGLKDIVRPINIRQQIANLHSQWNTLQQQDAEEFLTWLLDGLHEDLNLIKNKPYYELADSNNRNDEIVANEHWTLHLKRNQSIIVDLFQGQYKSTLQCPSCENISVKFDPFSSLTLPIPDKDTMISVKCLIFSSLELYNNNKPFKLTVNVSNKAVITQLINILKEKLNEKYLNKNDLLLVCRVSHNKFGKYWSQSRAIKKVVNFNNCLYIYQTKTTTIAKRKQDDLIQVRMNFCYQLSNNASDSSGLSGDSVDVNDNNNEKNNDNNNNKNSNDNRIFFAHPIVFDILLTEFTGFNLYEIFKSKYKNICKESEQKIPIISMYLRKEGMDNEININSNEQINSNLLTNQSRNVATINVQFTEFEYKQYINMHESIGDLDFNKLSDEKPKNGIDIYDCLKLYTAAEILDDIVWKCPKCHKKGQPSKQLHLWRLPDILIIHLKRFLNEQGYFGGVGRKITANIKTPIDGLDLKKYMSISNSNIDNIPKYDLFATLNHNGMMNFGHYYACIRTDPSTQITNFYQHYNDDAQDPQWNLFNDEKIHKITTDDLNNYIKDAYLLFYRRRNNV